MLIDAAKLPDKRIAERVQYFVANSTIKIMSIIEPKVSGKLLAYGYTLRAINYYLSIRNTK